MNSGLHEPQAKEFGQPLPTFSTLNKVTKLPPTFYQALTSYNKREKWTIIIVLCSCFNSKPTELHIFQSQAIYKCKTHLLW